MKRAALPLLLLCGVAHAQPPGGYISSAQVLQCVRDQQEVVTLNSDMTREKLELDKTGAELQQEQTELDRLGAELQQRTWQENQTRNQAPAAPPAVAGTQGGNPQLERYLAKFAGINGLRRKQTKSLAVHQKKQTEYNVKAESYNQRLAGLNQRTAIVNRYCAGAKVRPEDLAAAKAIVAAETVAPATAAATSAVAPPPPAPPRPPVIR